jgi:hypothetical protein
MNCGRGTMRTLIAFCIILTCVLFVQSDAKAVLGVADDLPGRDLVLPFICDKENPSKLNTLWAIADTAGKSPLPGSTYSSRAFSMVYDKWGILRLDYLYTFTPYDVVTDNCANVVSMFSDDSKSSMEMTIDGTIYYVGYLTVSGMEDDDRFVSWAHLYEPENGSIADYKPFQAEEGIDGAFSELGPFGAYPVTADELFPRYLILNDNPKTKNWWILLKGKSDSEYPPYITAHTRLEGNICNEEEMCISQAIPVPYRLNIINVENYLPPVLGTEYPKAGFGMVNLITQTQNILTGEISQFSPNESTFMWSYHNHYQETTDMSLADGKVLFGPQQFRCDSWRRCSRTYTFPSSGMTGTGRIIVKNGDFEGQNRVSRAEISLNGKVIFDDRDFSRKVFELEATVDIAERNELTVDMGGFQKGYIGILVKSPGIIKVIQSSGAGMLPVDRNYLMPE